jgi:chitodextrinase
MQAVNQSSTIGNIVTRQFRLDTTPQAAPAPLVLFDNTSLDNPPDTYTTFKNPRVTINGLESPAPYAPVPGVTSPVLTTFVRLYRGPVDTSDYSINAVAGGAAATGSTSLTLQDPGLLADGVYTYYAVAFDAAGNPSASSAGLTITVDTTTPTAPAPLTLVNNTDVYPANGLSVTNTPPPSITIGGIESFTAGKNGNLVILYRNGVKVTEQRIVGPDTTITLTDPGFLTEGVYSYTATQTDLAGNVSLPSSILTVAIDTTAPVGLTAVLDPTSDTVLARMRYLGEDLAPDAGA